MSNYMKDDSVYLHISCRGLNYSEMKVGLDEGIFRGVIPAGPLPEGILVFTMLDDGMNPVAERLYFNEKPGSRINIKLHTDKNIYKKREQTSLNVETTSSEGKPVKANLSVLVINKKQMGKMQSTRQNILSCLLLDSELKGEIENPGSYFSNDGSGDPDLDALMLTQGWRKYLYNRHLEEPSYRWEPKLTVTGRVSGAFLKSRKAGAELVLMSFGNNLWFHSQTTDSLGRFRFELDDEFGEEIKILVQSSNKSGRNVDYTISLDNKESPPVHYNQLYTVEKLDSVVHVFVEKDLERNKIDELFSLPSENVLLEEVRIEGYRITPARKKVMEKYGKPDEVIDGNAIREKEGKLSSGLYSVLRYTYPDKIIIKNRPNGDSYASVSGSDMTLVIIDGIPVKFYDYQHIPGIPPSEISSLEIIECAKNWCDLYEEAARGINRPGIGCPTQVVCCGVIALYTHNESGLYGIRRAVGLTEAYIPVFSEPHEFNAPEYENDQAVNRNKPDLRAIVHWEPVLRTDSRGNASIEFYNADNTGQMLVVVEAITENGEIGYHEITYEIEGTEQKYIIVE
jgi:hypothetical protein